MSENGNISISISVEAPDDLRLDGLIHLQDEVRREVAVILDCDPDYDECKVIGISTSLLDRPGEVC